MLQSGASSSNQLFAWLEARTNPSTLFRLAFVGILFLSVWVFCISMILSGIEWMFDGYGLGELRPEFVQHMRMSFENPLRMAAIMAIAVLSEEVWFRLLPFTMALILASLWRSLRFV